MKDRNMSHFKAKSSHIKYNICSSLMRVSSKYKHKFCTQGYMFINWQVLLKYWSGRNSYLFVLNSDDMLSNLEIAMSKCVRVCSERPDSHHWASACWQDQARHWGGPPGSRPVGVGDENFLNLPVPAGPRRAVASHLLPL